MVKYDEIFWNNYDENLRVGSFERRQKNIMPKKREKRRKMKEKTSKRRIRIKKEEKKSYSSRVVSISHLPRWELKHMTRGKHELKKSL